MALFVAAVLDTGLGEGFAAGFTAVTAALGAATGTVALLMPVDSLVEASLGVVLSESMV
jgi:hypothetical protein